MIQASCFSKQPAQCTIDKRRARVRASKQLAGLDYVEVEPNGTTLIVHFFGTVPESLTLQNVVIEGGRRIRDIQVLSARFVRHEDGDTCLKVKIDKPGDFSPYCICLIEATETAVDCLYDTPPAMKRKIPVGIDLRYACASFLFRTDCPATLDCKTQSCPPEPNLPSPAINYLARDFQSFRQMMLDRLLVTMPQYRERHLPDLWITLVELMAYVADQLSYSLDAVATEAYLATARLRISVRRHARLVDYRMHEGCNARTWICIEADSDQILELADWAFGVPPDGSLVRVPGIVDWETLRQTSGALIYEPIDVGGTGQVYIVAAHSNIRFHTWGGEKCCLPVGSTRASLRDTLINSPNCESDGKSVNEDTPARVVQLTVGDFLVLEEIRGVRSGALADADTDKRHVVRLTKVTMIVDDVYGVPVLDIEWGQADALPFTLCLSIRTDAPDCQLVETAVARGNVILVDHGVTVDESDSSWVVQSEPMIGCCDCEGAAVDVSMHAKRFSFTLAKPMLTHAEPVDPRQIVIQSASELLKQNPRKALASIKLDEGRLAASATANTLTAESETPELTAIDSINPVWRNQWDWQPKWDLLSSRSIDHDFVVEMDDDGFAHCRFGDNDCGWQPEPGLSFRARYRLGNHTIGNVGRDAIVWIARKSGLLSGTQMRPRNPLPASGGTEPEPVSQVRLYAPHAYSRVLERAVAALDYAELAALDARIDSSFAQLSWTGSWYEADVALDPLANAAWDASLATDIESRLQRVRRIGHDLRIVPVYKVPLVVGLLVCVEPSYSRSDLEIAIREKLSNHRLADGSLGLFHPDKLEFGIDIKASRIVAAVQALEGVLHVDITEFRRQDTAANKPYPTDNSFANNFINIRRSEIAQLDNDPDFPENGFLTITMMGGL